MNTNGQPSYLANKLRLREVEGREMRGWDGRTVMIPDYSLEVSRAGFGHRGGSIYTLNSLLIGETSLQRFKTGIREWVKEKIKTRLEG